MEALREITLWTGDNQPNHIYLIDGNKMLAYIKCGTNTPHYFKHPIDINKRGRKFVSVKPNPFETPANNYIEVKGSKGNSYFIDPDNKSCTCPGYTYHGTCKHLSVLK